MIVGSLVFMIAGFAFLMLGRGSEPNAYQFLSIAASLIAGTLLVMGFLKERKRRPAAGGEAAGAAGKQGGAAGTGPADVEADLKALEEGMDDEDLQPAGQTAPAPVPSIPAREEAGTKAQEPVLTEDAPMVSANRQWSTLISDVDKNKFEPPAFEKTKGKTEKEDAHTQGGPGKGNINMEQPAASASNEATTTKPEKSSRGFLGLFKKKTAEPASGGAATGAGAGSGPPPATQPITQTSGVSSPGAADKQSGAQSDAASEGQKGPDVPESEERPETAPIGEHLESVAGNVSAAAPKGRKSAARPKATAGPKAAAKPKTASTPRAAAKPKPRGAAKPKAAPKRKSAAKPKGAPKPQETPKLKIPAKPKTAGKSSGAAKPKAGARPKEVGKAKAKATGTSGRPRPTAKPKV